MICTCTLMPLIDVQYPRSTSQFCCAQGAMDISLFEYCWSFHAKRNRINRKSSLNLMQIHIWTTWFKGKFLIMFQKILVLFLFVCWCWWVLMLQNIWLDLNLGGDMFMPFDATHWCAISQVNLSTLLCSRCLEHMTV